ncbi:hypothetical protein ABZS76_19430 [Streptomyces sp. NPDC005562]|uniref:hypothetical protein n=1 Tax=unclassified Streptomyces TaxID=2593676 RepID=UPI0033A23229
MAAVAWTAVLAGPAPAASATTPYAPALAGAGAGILPWLAVAAVAALGIGAVTYALLRRRAD